MKQATIGGGCFWCLDALYKLVKGVESVASGFAGGDTTDVDYRSLHTSNTGHAEVVQITFNESAIGYEDILKIFFGSHDPTTPNRQGADVGPEYRSIILYHDEEQKLIAEKTIKEFASTLWDDPIVTELKPYDTFITAEDYHQDYYNKNENAGYCQVVINPKLAKFRKNFAKYLQEN